MYVIWWKMWLTHSPFPSIYSLSSCPLSTFTVTDTTIFFADLVGFTKWSAKRSPEQVFRLLENIYACKFIQSFSGALLISPLTFEFPLTAGFDEIAAQRGVFKVETSKCPLEMFGVSSNYCTTKESFLHFLALLTVSRRLLCCSDRFA